MRRVVTCLAIVTALVAIAVPAYARTVDKVIHLGGTAEGTVATGKATTIGVLIPAGARRVTATVQWSRKSDLDPALRVYAPDGSEITQIALEEAGGRVRTTSTRISLKKLPAAESGLYKFVLRGLDGTAGDYRLKCRGRATKYPKTESTLDTSAAFDEVRIDVPDGSFLSVDLGPVRKS